MSNKKIKFKNDCGGIKPIPLPKRKSDKVPKKTPKRGKK